MSNYIQKLSMVTCSDCRHTFLVHVDNNPTARFCPYCSSSSVFYSFSYVGAPTKEELEDHLESVIELTDRQVSLLNTMYGLAVLELIRMPQSTSEDLIKLKKLVIKRFPYNAEDILDSFNSKITFDEEGERNGL
ncbi:hypothetical protein BH753_gp028 [Bacillus phage Shbh1]|uniref:Uncharacterized protein n=1 Tax=Bacillus phage Shbh1 TaxID=1796992 RepID=A0A142F153_9CAUD|nr:hypothetical protein BH753_gp028 [Bacillus phage Shbh1]AMQ66510.1 hypothetical protein [Bacillus phage Shbh1]